MCSPQRPSASQKTAEEIEKSHVLNDLNTIAAISAEELKALDVESSKVIDLERFAAARRHRSGLF
jgi:hypothetical protein